MLNHLSVFSVTNYQPKATTIKGIKALEDFEFICNSPVLVVLDKNHKRVLTDRDKFKPVRGLVRDNPSAQYFKGMGREWVAFQSGTFKHKMNIADMLEKLKS